jgi:glycosyltransferase involved in cell wall biosynthesis
MSRAILEAMSMEKPIITTEVAGCNEVVKQNWNGYLVPSKDVQQLAEALVAMYNLSDDQRQQMGKNSRIMVMEKFDLRIILEIYDNLIEEIFNSSPYTYYSRSSGQT